MNEKGEDVMQRLGLYLLTLMLAAPAASAQDAVSFQGKTVNMIISSAAGGGTDAYGRVALPFFEKYLPGAPTIVARNVPGADGLQGMNYMVQQVAPDGLTFIVNANTTADPLNYRKPQSQFNPAEFVVVGGAGRGGEVLLINKAAEKRLTDKSADPVVMGSLGGIPRSGMQMTAWGVELLGWNAKWVLGYRGTNELMLALERGEIDMTSTGNLFLIQKLLTTGNFNIVAQSGTLKDNVLTGRPDFGNAPLLTKLVEGKLGDPLAAKAFEYWSAIAVTDKWVALPPKTPAPVTAAYRDAYDKTIADADFLERVRKISDDFVPMRSKEVETLIHKLSSLPDEATAYMATLLRKQGLQTQ
jgi:tripartite-type tricarboxylate transporter receptor subunit TctC